MSIDCDTPLLAWPGARMPGVEPVRAVALGQPTKHPAFGRGLFVRVRYVTGRRPGGTDWLALAHVEEESEPALFEPPNPPPTGVTIDVDTPDGWDWPPRSLRTVADAVRPFLAAGVEPLEVAVLVLQAQERA